MESTAIITGAALGVGTMLRPFVRRWINRAIDLLPPKVGNLLRSPVLYVLGLVTGRALRLLPRSVR